MSDEILSLIMRARDEMSGAVNKASGSLDRLGKSGSTANSILSGIGAGIGIAGVMGVSNAVSTLTNVLGDAVAAAREDEVSVRQLATALRDNVPAWDGQTGAIERTILKRQRLGFEDTALRGSLATLSAATHDVSRALELQSLAMDISRFRGIDLASASDMVAKATSGSLKALNAAIPATRGAASAQDALTIAIRATSGQADAYADTSLGKMEAASIRVGESLERLGYRILPAVADAADLAAGGIDLLTTAIDGLTVPLQTADEKSWDTGEAVHTVGYQAGWAAAQVNALIAPAAAAAAQLDSLSGSAINLKYAAINAGGAIVGLASANAALGNWTGYTTNAQTGFRFTQQQVNQAIVDGANAHQDYLATLNRTPATVGAVSARSTAALDRMIERLRALDAAQQVVFERMIRNLTTVVDKQLEAIDAAQAQRDADRQAIADKRDLAEAIRALGDAQAAAAAAPGDAGAQDALLAAQQRVSDIRSRIAESALRAEEDKLRTALEATKAYIEKVAELESQATNRKALANTLAAREKSLEASRAAALAAGDTAGVAQIDLKLAAIRAAEERNAQAMRIAQATTAVQVYTTVHTKITVDGKTLADIVDKYLGSKPTP